MRTPVRWCRLRAVASRRTGTRRPITASSNWPKHATFLFGGRAGPVSVTTVRAVWYQARLSTGPSHSLSPPRAISSCAARSHFATSSSTCDVWPQVKEEAAANECEADTRHHEGDEHRGREDCQDDERSTPCDASRARRDVGSLCVGQNFVLEDVVGDINAHKQSGVERDG